MEQLFQDRAEAGRQLAQRLLHFKDQANTLVLALPRGGVPVGYQIANILNVPLDIFVVRKLGVPGHEELAMGAIASGGVRILNQDVIDDLHISDPIIATVAANEEHELERREWLYREGRLPESLKGKTVLLVDDGLATGATMRAAILALRHQGLARLIVAVPVASASAYRELRSQVDELICVRTPGRFWAVGNWYDSFPQVSDEEVQALLETSAAAHG